MAKRLPRNRDEKARARSRGLVLANVRGFDEAIGEAKEFYRQQLEDTRDLTDPSSLPRFINSSATAGIWKSPTRYRFRFGGWQPFPPSDGDPGEDPTAMIGDSYHNVWPDWFSSWGSYRLSFGPIDPVDFDLSGIQSEIRDMIGATDLDRNSWQPGRMRWNDFRDAMESISRDAAVNWNAIAETMPSPPVLISLEDYDEIIYPHPVTGSDTTITLYRPESHSIEASGSSNKFEWARTAWEFWIEDVFAGHEGLKKSQKEFHDNDGFLDAAATALKMFKRGSQYPFRGK